MEDHSELRQAVHTWLHHAHGLPSIPQAITDVALATLPQWEDLSNAVSLGADRRDLFAKIDGDWQPSYWVVLGRSGLGDATRLIAQGASVREAEVADSFVAFCTAPAPVTEEWLLLDGAFPEDTRIPLGRHTLQTFTPDELRQLGPIPSIHDRRPGTVDLGLLTGAPFIHIPAPDRTPTRSTHEPVHGPRPEAGHWRSLLPLILWSPEPLRVEAVFDVERGRRFGMNPSDVPSRTRIVADEYGMDAMVDVRATGTYRVTAEDRPGLEAFCAAITAKIDAVMAGADSGRRLPRKRARRLERAARHLLRAYQRTFSGDWVWEEEADEVHLDYVIALEALMASPDGTHEGISKTIHTRASALFLTPDHRERAKTVVQKAYSARSTYVHGDLITERGASEKLRTLHELRLITRQVILRWLVITPVGTDDLGPLLDDAAAGTGREDLVDKPLGAFLAGSPPHDFPEDVLQTGE
ncbi:hypothetical protein ABZ883_38485 [Streptomyces sp. NPDC046977]|uniref:hypothetical protein n=1 Tax=Streptomyces sp. NPDC046977 TaxID=3154703 RepID=UPI0033C912A9